MLVQGGSGFSIRLPIVREDNWGQVSIVLRSDKLLEEIETYVEGADLELAIFNKVKPSFGYALFPEDGNDLEAVLREADSDCIWKKKRAGYQNRPDS